MFVHLSLSGRKLIIVCGSVHDLASLVHRDGTGRFADLLEAKSECRTNQADQHTETKAVDIAEERTLLLEHAVKNCERFLGRCPVASVACECRLQVRELLLKVRIELRHMPRKGRLARLRVARN